MDNLGEFPGPKWLRNTLHDPEYTDVTVTVKGGEEFKLHRVIICAQSDFFRAACKEVFKEGRERVIKLPEIDERPFDVIIHILYGGVLEDYEDLSANDFFQLWTTADFLGIKELFPAIMWEVKFMHECHVNGEGSDKFPFEDAVELTRKLIPICEKKYKARLSSMLGKLLLVNPRELDEYFEKRPEDLGGVATVALSRTIRQLVCRKCLMEALFPRQTVYQPRCSVCRHDIPKNDEESQPKVIHLD